MKAYYESADGTLYHGDNREVMASLRAESIDSVVTDPPYGLAFMGKKWDYDVPSVELWTAVLALCKPGAHLLSFAGTRTQHRMACAIEDAGFEIRDCIMWVYGSGFPKSLDVSKAIDKAAGVEREAVSAGEPVKRMIPGADQNTTGSWIKDNGREFVPTVTAPATDAAREWSGWGTALKPAMEPITVARKPLIGTVAENVLAHGTGAINVDGCRIEAVSRPFIMSDSRESVNAFGDGLNGSRAVGETSLGRWPANVIHDGGDEVLAGFPDAPGQLRAVGPEFAPKVGTAVYGDYGPRPHVEPRKDSGSAARFFYCAKASRSERGRSNTHPTVKPLDLMRYLCRLVTPPNGVILDPFFGSGTTGVAARSQGFRFIGIEADEKSCEIAAKRLAQGVLAYED